MVTPPAIVLATTNPGKLREVAAVLNVAGVRVLSLADFPAYPEPVEDGTTFAANAALKACYYSRMTGHWALADDSGLVVDALDGAPGILSARYAGPASDDQANNAKLVHALAGIPDDRRSARFRCALALADGQTVLATAEGIIEGRIIDHPRGLNGFGYDPHFLVPELDLTTAELSPEDKNRRSHRGQALRLILPKIASLLDG
ncbi:MAG: XTP/dITP diphosphatase [Planctomycetes bacterium]|nr:XTP/dITP diphosphatase [Planctomycetota bacterium]